MPKETPPELKPLLFGFFITIAIVVFGVPLVFFPVLVALCAKYVAHLPFTSIWPPLGVSLSGTLAAAAVLRLGNKIEGVALQWIAYSAWLVAGFIAFKFLYDCPGMDALQAMGVAGLPIAAACPFFGELFVRSRRGS